MPFDFPVQPEPMPPSIAGAVAKIDQVRALLAERGAWMQGKWSAEQGCGETTACVGGRMLEAYGFTFGDQLQYLGALPITAIVCSAIWYKTGKAYIADEVASMIPLFNDDPATTFELVHEVLLTARGWLTDGPPKQGDIRMIELIESNIKFLSRPSPQLTLAFAS